MPLQGGASDKAGNRYERRWTVLMVAEVMRGEAISLRTEIPGLPGRGFEFRLQRNDFSEWHQVKRQRSEGPWSIAALAVEGVVQHWRSKLQAGDRCVFVSSSSAEVIRELSERSRQAESWAEFESEFLSSEQLKDGFRRLAHEWEGAPGEVVFDHLKGIWVHQIGEEELGRWVDDRLASLVSGQPEIASAVLAGLVDDSLHVEISGEKAWETLAGHNITPLGLARDSGVVAAVAATAELFVKRLALSHIGGNRIGRDETDKALDALRRNRQITLAGGAGSGKSVIAGAIVERVREDGWKVLVVSAGRFSDASDASELGGTLGLPTSPVNSLAGISGGADCLLVVDQLDAVSIVSGRSPDSFSLVANLILHAFSHPNMRVLLACRRFDLDNDRDLRSIAASPKSTVIEVGDLSLDDVQKALASSGLDANLPDRLTGLLKSPLNLAVYVELARSGVREVSSAMNVNDLLGAFWSAKRKSASARAGDDLWIDVVDRLTSYMSDHQTLVAPDHLLDDLAGFADVMGSEGVIVKQSGEVSFFHEAFFDYCFARRFLSRGDTIQGLLLGGEQHLFRRAQVRQLLLYERSSNPTSFLRDLQWILASNEVRLHIKALAISLLQVISSPTPDEWNCIRPILEEDNPLTPRVWSVLRNNPEWFPLLDSLGAWSTWLNSQARSDVDRAIWALSGAATDYASRTSQLVDRLPLTDEGIERRLRFLSMADIDKDQSLFDLAMSAIEQSYYDGRPEDAWRLLYNLDKSRPEWGAQLVGALLTRALDVAHQNGGTDPFRTPLGRGQNVGSAALKSLAERAPESFARSVLPALLETMRRNRRPDWGDGGLMKDEIWSGGIFGVVSDLKYQVYEATRDALALAASQSPEDASMLFRGLMSMRYESAWVLLASGFAGNTRFFREQILDWVLREPESLSLGMGGLSPWLSKNLVAALVPELSDADLARLAESLIWYAPAYERSHGGLRRRGYTELGLLNSIPLDRRSDKVRRRLDELRRKFDADDIGPPPGIFSTTVPPPIPHERARFMSDADWLNAISVHSSIEPEWRANTLSGGALDQSQVLESVANESPFRFARLFLKLGPETAEPYLGALLRGLTGKGLDEELMLRVADHAFSLNSSEANRWLVRLIQSEASSRIPGPLVMMVGAIAASDADPERDTWTPDDATGTGAYYGGDIDMAGLNSTRGAAAYALGDLVSAAPSALPLVSSAFDALSQDPVLQVRAMAVGALARILPIDEQGAVRWFLKAVTGVPIQLLSSGYVERFLFEAVRRGQYNQVSSVVERMIDSDIDAVSMNGGKSLALGSYWDEDLDDLVTSKLGEGDSVRRGIVDVFAFNYQVPRRRDRAFQVLSSAFDDPVSEIRAEATKALYGLDERQLADYIDLLGRFAESQAIENAGMVFHGLESSRQALPPIVLELCERFVEKHRGSLGDISTAAAGDVSYVNRIVIRLLAQHSDPETTRRCLDLVDELIAESAYGLESSLEGVHR